MKTLISCAYNMDNCCVELIFSDGSMIAIDTIAVENEILRNAATAPVIWLNFLDGLLYAEDIPTLQEFIGYCLIPSNKGQRMMVIKGNGGEGKSQIGAVLSTIFGTNMKDGSIGMIDIVTKINNMMFEGAPLWDVIDACSVIDIGSCFDPIFEPPLDFLEECHKREIAAQSPFHTTVERKIGNTWYLVETECAGKEPLADKVKRLIFSDKGVAC